MTKNSTTEIISQAELDSLLRINEFIDQHDENSLVSELKRAILDSGKLETTQWEVLRDHIREIEELIPHIDLIIKLKKE
jgi:tRNA C32,U32 (ribose-2'-O)-methylase TrmJ